MSVTVADLIKLPSLRQAEVLGGHRGLNKIVSSISVLESTDPGMLVDGLFPEGDFYGSEIVVTGFLNIIDDVDCQCANLRRLSEAGEVGLILYYVGVYLPCVDKRLIELADELDFVLICMPKGQRNLRYGEVLSDVMECIYRDRTRGDSIVSEILARVSGLPRHQRTVSTVLKMLSDRISASVVLCDAAGHILNLEAWPRGLEGAVKEGVEAMFAKRAELWQGRGRLYRFSIRPNKGQRMELLLMKEGMTLNEELLDQAADLVRLSVNIWGEQHGEIAVHELVCAILQDDPMKMRRLADIFHIDVASIHEMWILQGGQPGAAGELEARMAEFKALLENCADTVVADMYEDCLLLFLSTPYSRKEAEEQAGMLISQAGGPDAAVTLTRCGGLGNTSEVRQAYLCHQKYLTDVRVLFPLRNRFCLGEVEFSGSCRELIDGGETVLKRCLLAIRALQTDHEGADLVKTLSVYLLDGESGVARTAKLLFVHQNTVKYRIRRISELLGYHPDKMPEGMKLYQAVAVRRLLE